MSTFTDAELEYLHQARLARVATVGSDGTPHVTPVGMWSHDRADDTIRVTGRAFDTTKKWRDVGRTGQAAIVIDDLASTEPWHPRGIEIRGRAEQVPGPRPMIRIHPDRAVSWGLDEPGAPGQPGRGLSHSGRGEGQDSQH